MKKSLTSISKHFRPEKSFLMQMQFSFKCLSEGVQPLKGSDHENQEHILKEIAMNLSSTT